MDGGCGAGIIWVYACAYMYIYIHIYIYIIFLFSSWVAYVVGCVGSFVYPSFCSYGAHVRGRVLPAFLGSVVGSQHASGMRVIHDS